MTGKFRSYFWMGINSLGIATDRGYQIVVGRVSVRVCFYLLSFVDLKSKCKGILLFSCDLFWFKHVILVGYV